MFKQTSVVDVSLGDERVGRLAQAPDRRCLFEYDPSWLQKGFSVSPFYLPLQSGVFTARDDPFNGMFGVFNDSLPDGWGQLLIDRWWQLSPAYDLLPSGGFNGNHTTTVNGQGKPTLKDALEVAKLVSFPEKRAMKIIDEVKAGLH